MGVCERNTERWCVAVLCGCVAVLCGCVAVLCGCVVVLCGCVAELCGCVAVLCGCVAELCRCDGGWMEPPCPPQSLAQTKAQFTYIYQNH
uniref:Uncharacterized protein n=1 Tax=Knipowitschia caucasica TaxID=637954 RepID=A0AAV2M083_KNICA